MLRIRILPWVQKQLLPHISRIFSALPELSQFRFVALASFLAFIALNVWMIHVHPNPLITERLDLIISPFSSANHMRFGQRLYTLGNTSDATKELQLADQVGTFPLPFSLLVPRVLGVQSEPKDMLNRWEQDRTYILRSYAFWKTVVEQHPDYRDAYMTLAAICFRLDKQDAAMTYINAAYALDPNNAAVKEFAAQLGVLL